MFRVVRKKDYAFTQHSIRPVTNAERTWVRDFIIRHWGAEIVIVHGAVYRPHELPGFIAYYGDAKIGLVTYQIDGDACEIVTLDSMRENIGVGTALIKAVKDVAQLAKCKRLWLITTNDNLHALRFYQKRGFFLVAVHRNALDASRKIKPQIPLIGDDGIPLRDEIELEMALR
jgi:ribosomal protein S18 acetylase RimI-like enzyme